GDETPAFNKNSHGLIVVSRSIGDRIIPQLGDEGRDIAVIAKRCVLRTVNAIEPGEGGHLVNFLFRVWLGLTNF
ncbi:MAG: hypothetical protein WBB29_20290, partial [Geitlerinemataceae cyanobacterium]